MATLIDWLSNCILSDDTMTNSMCSEHLDYLYALLGISSDFQDGQLLPDYSNSPLEVFERLLEHWRPSRVEAFGKKIPRALGKKLALSEEEISQTIANEVACWKLDYYRAKTPSATVAIDDMSAHCLPI
jgi:hypothetical protein